MMSMIPKSRAIVLAAGLVLATSAFAAAQEPAGAAAAEEVKAEPFKPTIYFGPGFGIENHGDFGWALHVLARIHQYGGLQIEYFDAADDGLYVGLMPILPLPYGLGLFGQIGGAFSENSGVAGGGGVLYDVPWEFLHTNNVNLVVRADYKYIDIDSGSHLFVLGMMIGFHK